MLFVEAVYFMKSVCIAGTSVKFSKRLLKSEILFVNGKSEHNGHLAKLDDRLAESPTVMVGDKQQDNSVKIGAY